MPRTKEGCERERIKKQIRECFSISNDSNIIIESLVDDLYWQIIKLRECRKLLDEQPVSVEFKQGKQEMNVQNPIQKTYNDLLKNQNTTIKTIMMLTGKKAGTSNGLKDMLAFLNKPKK